MLRRTNFSLLLLALLQLVLLFGAPVSVVGGAQTIAKEASAVGATFVGSMPVRQEKAAAVCSEWTNQENDPEYFVHGSSTVNSRWITPRVHPCRAIDIICRTHPACSAPARGPPAA